MSKKILLDAPNVGPLEKKHLNMAIDSGFVSSVGPFVEEFENIFEKYIGVKKAVSTQSGTAAIHVALHELGIGRGDEVIVPALTFVATVNPILQLGATPVIVDVDKETWNISPEAIEEHITPKTKAIIPVHLYGNPCDMQQICAIARKHKLSVIEDATESLGATYGDRQTGSLGDFGCFSFNGNKIITTGGGGMITGNNIAKLEHIKFIINQAKSVKNNGVYHPEIGFNYRMTNIEAAIGLAQMQRLADFLKKKKTFYGKYVKQLSTLEHIQFQKEYPNAKSSWWLTCILVNGRRDIQSIQARLVQARIPSRRIFVPMTDCAPYKKYQRGRISNAQYIFNHGLCLPSSTCNSVADIEIVSKIIREQVV